MASLFAFHPLHVEPVAWVSARKDVLSSFFLMLTSLSYLRYISKPKFERYMPILGFYLLSLLAKPMMVTLPYLLLLLDYWPFQRIKTENSSVGELCKLLLEKIPLIILSFIFSLLAYYAQFKSNAVSSFEQIPIFQRIVNVLTSYSGYITKTIWPLKLSIITPLPHSHSTIEMFSSILILSAIFFLIFKYRIKTYLIVGWLWFFIALLPVIGIMQIGSASIADRFTYIPLIGPFIVAAWGIHDIFEKKRIFWQKTAATLAVTLLIIFLIGSWRYINCWENNITLYTEALRATKNNFIAMNNLAWHYVKRGEMTKPCPISMIV